MTTYMLYILTTASYIVFKERVLRQACSGEKLLTRLSSKAEQHLQGTSGPHSGHIQGTFSSNQGTFRAPSGHIQPTFSPHSANTILITVLYSPRRRARQCRGRF
jgi:hypothetical protein